MPKKHEEPIDLRVMEETFYSEDVTVLCGIDEAGRGPLAGPVCAAAVILPRGLEIPGLNDSKKLTDARRRALFEIITKEAVDYGIAFASHEEIDELNILQATFLAMNRAFSQLKTPVQLALVDGNRDPGLPVASRTIVGGDGLCASVAAASILAKVTRDTYMEHMDERYPGYGFAVHKGYGTKRHYEALRQLGECPIHRRSFLKKFHGA